MSICVLLTVTVGCVQSVSAADGELDYDINPRYQKYVKNPEDLFKHNPPFKLYSDSVDDCTVFTDYKSAAMYIRDCMLKRQTSVTVGISNNITDNLEYVYKHNSSNPYYAIYGAFSYEIARYDNDGDYLASSFVEAKGKYWTYSSYIKYTFTIAYRTTADEEKAVEQFVDSTVNEIKAKNLSRLEQVKAVHDKICSVTEYDWDSYNSGEALAPNINTAYDAVKNGKTMCEGYSALFYRICRRLGIPVRTITSNTHAWNLVKPIVGKYYYNIDVTWDDAYSFPETDAPYGCMLYLKNNGDVSTVKAHRNYLEDSNTDHDRIAYYSSDYFNSHFPTAESSFYLDDNGSAACPYCMNTVDGQLPTPNDHIYAQTTVLPTCIKNGKTIYACTHCSEGFEESIAATGVHLFSSNEKYCAYGCGTVNPDYVPPVTTQKKTNTLVAKGKAVTVKYSKLKKKNQSLSRKKVITIKNPQGALSYKKSKGNKKITVSKAGKITVKKGLKKGTYKVKIKVTASGNENYKALTKTVTVKITVN